LKYALTKREVCYILMQRLVKIDGKVRTDSNFPAGFMDVVTIEQTKEHFRLLYDTKGRFHVLKITPEEAEYKLARVKSVQIGAKGVPYLVTHDGRTIRYPDPAIKKYDTVQVDLATGKITSFLKFETGNLVMITGGNNAGRVGVIENREHHAGSYHIVHVKDAHGHTFATRDLNVFVIGKGTKPLVSLPHRKGVKSSVLEEQEHFLRKVQKEQIAKSS